MDRLARLGETIKQLCGQVIVAEGAELDRLMGQLRQALHDHSSETRKLAVKTYSAIAAKTKN